MCGLVGLVNKHRNGFTKDQQEVFSTLMFVDYLRGPDSTGVILVTNEGEVSVAKEASHSIDFLRSKEYDTIMSRAWDRGSALIGHNRKATRGNINDENAHPFIVDNNIILVHNGTLWGNHKKLADVEVDSHAIAHTIHEKGDVTEALRTIDGAYALIWYDFKKGTLNFIRNQWRPLWWMETNNAWIWSSEKCMLDFVIARHNITVKEGPTELTEDFLQFFTLSNSTWSCDYTELDLTKPPAPLNLGKPLQQGVRHPYANGFYDEEEQDVPFDMKATVPANDLPSLDDRIKRMMGPGESIVDPTKYAQFDPPGTTPHFERELAKKNNKVIPLDEWTKDISHAYKFGAEVIATAFDYCYANQKDDSGGFYLYAAVSEDPDVMVRAFFDKKNMTEERIIAMAGCEYGFKFKINKKRWAAMAPGTIVAASAGFVIMEAEKTILLWGGGVGDPQYASKTERRENAH